MTEATIELDALLVPISAESPAGVDLREDTSPDSPYYSIKGTRQKAREEERSGILEDDSASALAEWRKVAEQAPELLSTQTKDLEIAVWYTEALVRIYGFAGLRDAFQLTRGLIDAYWDDLYPRPDEDGIFTRIAPLTGLNGEDAEGTLIIPIHNVEITEESEVGPFASWHFKQASDVGQISDAEKREKRIAGGAVTLDQITQAGSASSTEFLRAIRTDLDECVEAFSQLCETLDERCGADAPPSSNIRNALAACSQALSFLSGGRDMPDELEELSDADQNEGGGEEAVGRTESGVLSSRDEALRTLLKVAEYFRRNEPHSPLSYLLEQSVRWGRMSLPDLWSELIEDQGARKGVFQLAGIRVGAESELDETVESE